MFDAEYAGYTLTAPIHFTANSEATHPWDAQLGPYPVGTTEPWRLTGSFYIGVPVLGDYFLDVDLLFDTSSIGSVYWAFNYVGNPTAIVDAIYQDPQTGLPPARVTERRRIGLDPSFDYYVRVQVNTNDRNLLAGSRWTLALACATGGPLPPDVWCEPFIPQNADDADILYNAHLERMNDLSIMFP